MKDTLKDDKEFILPVYGKSMKPLLNSGDCVVLIKPCNLKKNDMILYQRNDGKYIFHRIRKIKDNAYSLLKDSQTNEEYPVYKEAIIAVANGYIKNNKEYNLSHFKYKLYLYIWKFKLIRRIYFKIHKI